MFEPIDEKFVAEFAEWVAVRQELLAVASYGAGDRDYWFCKSLDDLWQFCALVAPGYEQASLAVFPASLLLVRGVVDEAFIEKATRTFSEFDELLVLQLTPRKTGLLCGNACENNEELVAELRDSFGVPVAVGVFPEWDSFSTRPLEETGYIHTHFRRLRTE